MLECMVDGHRCPGGHPGNVGRGRRLSVDRSSAHSCTASQHGSFEGRRGAWGLEGGVDSGRQSAGALRVENIRRVGQGAQEGVAEVQMMFMPLSYTHGYGTVPRMWWHKGARAPCPRPGCPTWVGGELRQGKLPTVWNRLELCLRGSVVHDEVFCDVPKGHLLQSSGEGDVSNCTPHDCCNSRVWKGSRRDTWRRGSR